MSLKVFRVMCEVNDRPYLVVEERHKSIALDFFHDGKSKAQVWSPLACAVDGATGPAADFMHVNFGPFPAVNPPAKAFLSEVLGQFVEFLPLDGVFEDRWLAHVLLVSDCLDEERTDFRSSGVPFRYAFDERALNDLPVPVFQLTRLSGVAVFAAETFRPLYEDSGLSGLILDPLLLM